MPAKVRRMFAVESNMIHKIGFDHATPGLEHGYLVVQFSNLDVWAYENVPHKTFLELMNAVSVGDAFNKLIKKEFKGTKISSERDTHVVAKGAVDRAPSTSDDVPMLDVMGVQTSDSGPTVGKATSTVRRKK